jgi:hypothetical protein
MDPYLHLLGIIKELEQISEWLNENKNVEAASRLNSPIENLNRLLEAEMRSEQGDWLNLA